MDIEAGDTALAFFARGSWGLWPARAAEAGESGVALRTPLDIGVFAAKKAEADKPGVVVASPAGIPGVVRFPDDDEDDDGGDDDEYVGGEPCFGPHLLCSRLFCAQRVKRNYVVLLSGWPTDCGPGPINGGWTVAYAGDCRWFGTAGGWELELQFFSMSGGPAWEVGVTSGSLRGYAYTTGAPYEPEQAHFTVTRVPCQETNVQGASVVVV